MVINSTIDNRYIVIREVGEGGFATVYKAWATNLERFIAIKKINESYSGDAKFLDMFRNEAVNTAKLDHPNIVRVIDFLRTSTNIYYIVMEYAKGKDLRYLIQASKHRNMKIPAGICLYIAAETLKALDFAYKLTDEITHQPLNIVHRDISPGNIMIYFDGRIKLTDFGIAKVSSTFGERNKEGILRGKVSYMSPEQANGSTELDNRSDIFSVGIVLYEAITGTRLFEGKSDYDIWNQVKRAKIDLSAITKATHISDPIKKIIMKALASDRDARYATADAMVRDIKNFLAAAYDVQADGLKEFLLRCIPQDVQAEENEKFDQSRIAQQTPAVETTPSKPAEPPAKVAASGTADQASPSAPQPKPAPKPSEPKKPARPAPAPPQHQIGGEKTVFDFVLDNARHYEKILKVSFLLIVVAALGYAAADIYLQLTPLGKKAHGHIWPPALTIDSDPPGATVSLVDDKGNAIAEESIAPLNIEKIVPGNYTLTMRKSNFKDIERRITVRDSENILAAGAVHTRLGKTNYLQFRFETLLQIQSKPPGATVYLNGKKLPGTTPVKQYVTADRHTVKMELKGFEPLGSTKETASYGQCWVDLKETGTPQRNIDRRHWSFSRSSKEGNTVNTISGTFWKMVRFTSDPPGTSVFIGEEKEPAGKTPVEDVRLKVGIHPVRFALGGYQPVEQTVTIDIDADDTIHAALKRFIWFRSYNASKPSGDDLHAYVTVKNTAIKRKKTPFRIPLPLNTYSATFSKKPMYKTKTIKIHTRKSASAKAHLKINRPFISITVTDSLTGEPLKDAYILFNEIYLGSTDEDGIWENSVDPGMFTIKVTAGEKFIEQTFELELQPGARHAKSVILVSPGFCTLDIDTRPHFIGAQIYVDDIYEEETIRKLTKMTCDTHTILIRHFNLEEDISTEVIFSKPKQTIEVRLDETGKFIIK